MVSLIPHSLQNPAGVLHSTEFVWLTPRWVIHRIVGFCTCSMLNRVCLIDSVWYLQVWYTQQSLLNWFLDEFEGQHFWTLRCDTVYSQQSLYDRLRGELDNAKCNNPQSFFYNWELLHNIESSVNFFNVFFIEFSLSLSQLLGSRHILFSLFSKASLPILFRFSCCK